MSVGDTRYGEASIEFVAIRCSNVECRELTLTGAISGTKAKRLSTSLSIGSSYKAQFGPGIVKAFNITGKSVGQNFPAYVPDAIVEDYREAYAIRELSPKASATLARRCLQGMIRDFCKISKSRLIDEIKALKAAVDDGNAPQGVHPDTVDAIDAIRELGNIGAHMERDIDVIVEVDEDEAQILLQLIETLIQEWYVARHDRDERLKKVREIANSKKPRKAEGPAPEA